MQKSRREEVIKVSKLQRLAEIEGLSVNEMLEQATFDGICPGICINPGCEYTTEVEPDQDKGWCEECQQNTVKSALTMAGII